MGLKSKLKMSIRRRTFEHATQRTKCIDNRKTRKGCWMTLESAEIDRNLRSLDGSAEEESVETWDSVKALKALKALETHSHLFGSKYFRSSKT